MDKVKQVNELRKKGMNVSEAAKQVGMSLSRYYVLNRSTKKKVKRTRIKVTDIASATQSVPISSKCLMFVGSTDELLAIMRSL